MVLLRSSMPRLGALRRQLLAESFPEEWEAWLASHVAHYSLLNSGEKARLRDAARIMIAEKSWQGCDGLKVTDLMKLTIAAQAALLLLGLDHDYFSHVLSVALFPSRFETPAEYGQERGGSALGRAVDYGTVFLSWDTALTEARDPSNGHNLVIHEFAHQLDFLDGYTNGTPVLRGREQTQQWQQVMQGAFQRLRRSLQLGQKTFLGSYAATNLAEFFSVASERFFCCPAGLRQNHPELFDVLATYYGVNPSLWFEAKRTGIPPPIPSSAEVKVTTRPQRPLGPFQESDFIDLACAYCGQPASFLNSDVGKLKQCPHCVQSMLIPERGQAVQRIPFPIRTGRLMLRRLQSADAGDLANFLSDSALLRYLPWRPMSLEEVEDWITEESRVAFPKPEECCYFAIETHEHARVVGVVSFWFSPKQFNLAGFEIIIHPNWQRRGYATEAIRALLALAFAGLRARRVAVECDARNVAAQHLLIKSGMRKESELIQDRFLKGEWVNTVGFALLKQEFGESIELAKRRSAQSEPG